MQDVQGVFAKYSSRELLKVRIAFSFEVAYGEYSWLPDNYLQPYDGEAEFERLNLYFQV